jgi:predicted dehydrogenase
VSDFVRMGVIGVGALAQRAILPHLSQEDVQDRVRLSALCDPVAERLEAAARKYSITKVFGRVDELVSSGEVDAVTIASPIGLHYEHGITALKYYSCCFSVGDRAAAQRGA